MNRYYSLNNSNELSGICNQYEATENNLFVQKRPEILKSI